MALTESEKLELNNLDQELKSREPVASPQENVDDGMQQIMKLIGSKKIIKSVEQKIDMDISDLGILETGKNIEKVKSGGIGSKVIGCLSLAAEPFQRAESAIANVGLAAQRGVINPKFLSNEFMSGARGVKQGQYGDIAKAGLSSLGIEGVGANIASATIGFVASMLSPIAAVSRVTRTFGKLSKFTDKGIKIAGQKLVNASDDAVKIIGKELDNVYAPFNNVKGKTNNALFESLSKLPKSVVDDITEQTGKSIEDIVLEPTVGNLREVKSIVGSFRPSQFRREAVGADILKEGRIINKAYSNLKDGIQEILKDNGLSSAGKKILQADDAFSEVISASKFVKSNIVDKTLRLPTKSGKIARGITTPGDITTRQSLNTLKGAGGSARKNIVIAVRELEKYNNIVKVGTAAKRGLQVVQNAAVIGLLLKTPVGKSILRSED